MPVKPPSSPPRRPRRKESGSPEEGNPLDKDSAASRSREQRGIPWGWLAPVLILAAAFGVYWNSLDVPFLYDDIGSIPENSTIRHLGQLGEILSPPHDTSVAGRPVLNLSFGISYALSGLGVWSYHLLNILIHAGAGLALFGVLRRAFLSNRLRERFAGRADALALVAALLWVVHPLQTESVTYIVQRAEALVGLFYLLLFYCVVRQAGASGPGIRAGWSVAAVLVCLLGMGSKEVMATAPVLVLLYDRTFLAGSFRQALAKRRGLYVSLAATWIVVALVTRGARSASAGFQYQGVTPLAYARSQFGVILHYLGLSVWPHPLVFHYAWPVATSLPRIAAAGAVVLGLVAATAWALRFRPALGFCGAWFFLILAPTSTIIPIADLAYEHRMYLPLTAVVALLVAGADLLLKRLAGAEAKRAGIALAASAVLLFGVLSASRNRAYGSAVSIWSDTAAKRPDNYKARYNLAFHLERENRVEEAVRQYEEALRIRPGEREALNSLGMLLARNGRSEEGIRYLSQALDGAPDPAEIHMNLGLIEGMRGHLDQAIAHYEEVLRQKPRLATAHFNLANALLQKGRPEEAARHYTEAIQIKPDFAPAHVNLASLLASQGRQGEAAAHFRTALETQPDNAKAHYGLAMELMQEGKADEAKRHLEEALRSAPDFSPARQALGQLAGAPH